MHKKRYSINDLMEELKVIRSLLEKVEIFPVPSEYLTEVELPFDVKNFDKSEICSECLQNFELPDLNYLAAICHENGNRTVWENDKIEHLNIFSKDLQSRAKIHIEYNYIINIANKSYKFNTNSELKRFLADNGIPLEDECPF